MKIMDIHSHTFYSSCGKDAPEVIIERAIESGIEIFGISDHNYGIGERKEQYYKEISDLKEKYKNKIKLLVGIEITTRPHLFDIKQDELLCFDYCLVEHLDQPETNGYDNPIEFLTQFKIPTGIAHTNLFGYCQSTGRDPKEFFNALANENIFWEMNVNYDSIHSYREHGYVKEFLESDEQQKTIRDAGVMLSVGFDGHKVEDYLPERVTDMCKKLENFRSAEEILLKNK